MIPLILGILGLAFVAIDNYRMGLSNAKRRTFNGITWAVVWVALLKIDPTLAAGYFLSIWLIFI